MKENVIAIGIFLSVLLAGCTNVNYIEARDTFTIGFIPVERASELTPKAEKLGNFLEEKMGMEVEVIVPTSYEPLIEGLRFGHIDAAYMDSGPAWLAHTRTDAEVVLAELKDGNPFYFGEVFVRKTSNIEKLEDVKGKRIAFTSWTGSSGFILPVGTMVNRGIVELQGDDFVGLEKSLQNTFKSYTVAGGYKQALDLLVKGQVDMAGGAHDAPERFLDKEDARNVKTLERLGKVPSHPVVIGKHISEEVKEKFVEAMLELNKEENIQILKDLYGVDGLVATNTQEHLGDFGPAFEALTGIHDKVFNKHIKDAKDTATQSQTLKTSSKSTNYAPRTREYFIAAEEVEWDYAPTGRDLLKDIPITEHVWGEQTKYEKVRYIEYTDETFKTKKEQPEWLGILGPTIRAVEGDTIKVVFWNKASQPYSIHPHGVFYDKDNEGAGYSGVFGKGASVRPGEKYTYEWKVTEKAAPGPAEGSSKVWVYHSHVDSVGDVYQGLIGSMIITSAKNANNDATPNDIDKEFVNLYFIFNEADDDMDEEEAEGHLMHAMNGYIFGNLQGLEMNKGDNVRWHLIGMGTEVDLHTAHWHGETVNFYGRHTDVIELLPASMVSVDMTAENVGEWMYHCHVADHITAGMMTTYTINA